MKCLKCERQLIWPKPLQTPKMTLVLRSGQGRMTLDSCGPSSCGCGEDVVMEDVPAFKMPNKTGLLTLHLRSTFLLENLLLFFFFFFWNCFNQTKKKPLFRSLLDGGGMWLKHGSRFLSTVHFNVTRRRSIT